MTEQQIDAELCRYEPGYDERDCAHYWARQGSSSAAFPKSIIGATLHALLCGGTSNGHIYRDYPTREAAFADLRCAIALSNTQTT